MENEISKTGQKLGRTARNDVNFNEIPLPSSAPPLQFSNYAGDVGFTGFRPSELEIRMMMRSRLRHSNLLNDLHRHQDLMDRQYALLSHMEETATEIQALRDENINLKMVNAELTDRLGLLLRATSEHAPSVGCSGQDWGPGTGLGLNSVLNGLGRLSLPAGVSGDTGPEVEADGESPNSGSEMHSERVEGRENAVTDPDRVSLPKSISVRSNGYLRTVQTGGSSGGQQRVYVPGGEAPPVELEVYNQGMMKTELCNKWQETGACSYGENCQFAHGIKELRPIIRHPRYKTQVCRMVLYGDHCPYGHRCHFRHVLTDEENRNRSMNVKGLKRH